MFIVGGVSYKIIGETLTQMKEFDTSSEITSALTMYDLTLIDYHSWFDI